MPIFMTHFLLWFILLFVTGVDARDKRCLTLFDSNRSHFNVCQHTECFIFRTEIPFVFVPDTMNSMEHQKPFPCSEYKQQYKNLSGPFFDIVKATETLGNAQCVWGGSECQFDDMVKFVRRSKDAGNYKFIAGGLLFMLKYRMSEDTIASAPMLDDILTVIGPRDDDGTTFEQAWTIMWRPFSPRAWTFLFLTALCIGGLRAWISYHFTKPWSWHQFRDNLLGDYVHSHVYTAANTGDGTVARFQDPSELRRLNTYLSNGAKIVFVIVILYYEISIVNFVFSEHRQKMEKFNPEQFVITGNSTMSKKFKEYIGEKEYPNCLNAEQPCFLEVDNIKGVYDTITSQNNSKSERYRYSAVYETLNRYWFKKNSSLCEELQVFEYSPLNRRFAGVWYYSSNIVHSRRTQIDMAIVQLRETDQIRRIVHQVAGSQLPANCESNKSIEFLQLAMPLFFFSGPIFLAVVFYMALYTIIKWRNSYEKSTHAHGEDDDDDGQDGNEEQESNQNDVESQCTRRRSGFSCVHKSNLPSMSQISFTTTSDSTEAFGELLEQMHLEAQIRDNWSASRRRWMQSRT